MKKFNFKCVQQFTGKIFILKISGQLLENENFINSLVSEISFLTQNNIKIILVFGNGPQITKKLGSENKQNGVRITSLDDIKFIKTIVQESSNLLIKKFAINNINIHFENQLFSAISQGKTWQQTGIPVNFNQNIWKKISKNKVIIIGCLANNFNINADKIVDFLATKISTEKVIFFSQTAILDQNKKLISELTPTSVKSYIENKIITGGMLEKVKNILNLLKFGIERVHILSAENSLLEEIFTDDGCGTMLLQDKQTSKILKKSNNADENEKLFIPNNFKVTSKFCALRSHGKGHDVAFFVSDIPANFAVVTTQNSFIGEPVKYCRNIAKKQHEKKMSGILIHVGQANVGTGQNGYKIVEKMAELAAIEINSTAHEIFVAGTGVIGQAVKFENFAKNFPNNNFGNSQIDFENSAQAILTTDLVEKIVSIQVDGVNILAITKGSGMIEPNMATMLSVILTDAKISNQKAQEILKRVTDKTFNSVSVDSDTSTSDMVFLLANGTAKNPEIDLEKFEVACEKICKKLARKIAIDGEGATKLLTVKILEAKNTQSAKKMAKSVVNSPLLKTAIFGNDGNWGRIAMAIGKTCEPINPEKMQILIGDFCVYNGQPVKFDEEKLTNYLKTQSEIIISVAIGVGEFSSEVWGCDLSHDYIKINAEYRT
jgi:glutamate N-acetyltransferase/amino-acid N-acetyltransferase